jgi:hypothetical protein
MHLGADVEMMVVWGAGSRRERDSGNLLDQGTIALFGLAQIQLRLLLGGDVDHETVPKARPPGAVARQHGLNAHPAHGAVQVHHTVLAAERLTRRVGARHFIKQRGDIVRVCHP